MRRRAASAAAGAVALFAGFGITHFGIQDRTPAGHREPSQTLAAAFSPSALVLEGPDDQFGRDVARQAEEDRLAAERAETVAREAREAEEAEAVAEAGRLATREAQAAAERVERARVAAQAPRATETTVRTPVGATSAAPRSGGGGGNTSGVDINCESGGNYATNTGNGFYGAYQFMLSTWREAAVAAGYPEWANTRPDLAPAWVQDAVAAHHAIKNRGAWPNC